MIIPRPWQSDGCTCPPWQATQCDPDGFPEDYGCPDDACACELHCAPVCWCGEFPAVGCPTHLPAPGGAA